MAAAASRFARRNLHQAFTQPPTAAAPAVETSTSGIMTLSGENRIVASLPRCAHASFIPVLPTSCTNAAQMGIASAGTSADGATGGTPSPHFRRDDILYLTCYSGPRVPGGETVSEKDVCAASMIWSHPYVHVYCVCQLKSCLYLQSIWAQRQPAPYMHTNAYFWRVVQQGDNNSRAPFRCCLLCRQQDPETAVPIAQPPGGCRLPPSPLTCVPGLFPLATRVHCHAQKRPGTFCLAQIVHSRAHMRAWRPSLARAHRVFMPLPWRCTVVRAKLARVAATAKAHMRAGPFSLAAAARRRFL